MQKCSVPCVWNSAYVCSAAPETQRFKNFVLIREGRAKMIGPIRQEVLSGIRETSQFNRLRGHLQAFPDEPLVTEDFEHAAQCNNQCRSKGISGSHTDFLICAVALSRGWQIFTTDPDFDSYASVLALGLLRIPGQR